MIKKALASVKAKAIKALKALSKNKVQALHTALLVFIAVRVEQIHAAFQALTEMLAQIGIMLFINISAPAQQFHAAIDSILSLFNGPHA